ncbi:MAG: beta-mannanase [Ruminiclostridium sp.]|nr:beta-mannanase [Ruminiclostridium sp.]
MYKTDFYKLEKSLDYPTNPDKLVSKQASESAAKLFEYLKSIYGKKHLSGQQYLLEDELEDMVYYPLTGKLPAVRGYDFMGVSSCKKTDNQVDRAIEWATKCGGIVTMCWHWYAPNDMDDYSKGSSFYYETTNYNHKTSFDISRAVTEGTKEYNFIIKEIDMVSAELKRMAELDIPVLWRPLHEANGNWFWWGNHNEEHREAYKKLWYIIFDRMENYHKLPNLIWVWNGQDKCMEVNPNTYDIYGDDIYSQLTYDHTSQKERYTYGEKIANGKMLTLSECGYIPHPDEMKKDGVKWLWWLPWWGEFVYAREGYKPLINEKGYPIINEKYMTEDFLKEIMGHKDVISLQDLPWWDENKYTLPETLKNNLKRVSEQKK